VEDDATQELMGALYRARWQHGLGIAEAMRAAALETLRARRSTHRSDHPFFWSGFVAVGDWR
jgi:CHAT domain-containing protein